jgi:hypothetical protein
LHTSTVLSFVQTTVLSPFVTSFGFDLLWIVRSDEYDVDNPGLAKRYTVCCIKINTWYVSYVCIWLRIKCDI